MPAEWEHHVGCLILYPHNTAVFRNVTTTDDNGIDKEHKCGPARREVRNIARAICNYGKEDVFLFCNSEEEAEKLRVILNEEAEEEGGDIGLELYKKN